MNILDQVSTDSFPPRPERSWSPYQSNIFDSVEHSSENLLIQAVAGSGKTTTLEEISHRVPSTLLCFNKPIAEAARARGINAKTLHSFGNSAWWRATRGAKTNFEKLDLHLSRIFGDKSPQAKQGYLIKRVVSAIKNSGMGLTGELEANEISWAIQGWDNLDVPEEDLEMIAQSAQRVWRASVYDTSCLDYDDMLYGPLYHGWDLRQRDLILVDEAQDLNNIQHLLLQAMQTRIIAVGDRWQAIYAFRGALSDSMDRLREHFQMHELPLSICYRCPESVLREARKLCPHIEARPGAAEGLVLSRAEEYKKEFYSVHEEEDEMPPASDPQLFPDSMLVLCRNNAPLFQAVMRHVREQVPCRVLSNALEGLSTFISRFKTSTILELQTKIERWMGKEAEKHAGAPWRLRASEDKVATILVLCEHFSQTSDLLRLLKTLSEGRSGPIFSTIHKAKGLEAREVYFLRPDLCPSPWAKTASDREQERNLRYVAVTRAQESLTFGVSEI
jgi:superfamily I DNA/RNA helicase